jgi:hypothetical protein
VCLKRAACAAVVARFVLNLLLEFVGVIISIYSNSKISRLSVVLSDTLLHVNLCTFVFIQEAATIGAICSPRRPVLGFSTTV